MNEKIKQYRLERGWTQDELADRIGASKTHVSEMESGKKNPSRPMLLKLAREFGVKPSTLIDDGSVDLSEDERALIEVFRRSSPATREHLLGLLASQVPDAEQPEE